MSIIKSYPKSEVDAHTAPLDTIIIFNEEDYDLSNLVFFKNLPNGHPFVYDNRLFVKNKYGTGENPWDNSFSMSTHEFISFNPNARVYPVSITIQVTPCACIPIPT